MKQISRRTFLAQTAVGLGGISLSARSFAQVNGANEDIRVGVVGFKGRGGSHINEFSKMKGVRLAGLCDADESVLKSGAAQLDSKGIKVATFKDVRQMLDSKEIDVISVATPNHWHALMTVWGCQAGKDVYAEKPVSHNVWEGRKAVEAARKYNRIVQTGTQSRSDTALREALTWVREGNLGRIKVARGLCYKRRGSIGKVDGPQPIPAGIDYNLWCGPAPMEPLRRANLHYDWHWVWPTGNGDLGNQGIHQMDIARWALGVETLSPQVMSLGGRVGYDDDGETPNTQMIIHDYREVMIIFEVRGLPARPDAKEMDRYRGQNVGHVIECEGGYLAGKTAFDNNDKEIKSFKGSGENHYGNFIKAVRSRKMEDLNADILEGHLSSALCHTGNISHRLGQEANPDELREKIKGNQAALETLARMEQHLGVNGVDINMEKLTAGVFLEMDPKSERFIGNDRANELLTREYRKPFVVPDKV
ncbi:MAG: Gfo/Idh/MocA family protein [Verrucomicrobiales bacterium]